VTASPSAYFEREYFELHPGKRRYLRFLVDLLRDSGVANGRVLDVGSGYGFFVAALGAAGYRGVGLERSPHAAAVSRRSGVPVVCGEAQDPLPFREERFAAITLLDVIEHLPHYAATLRQLRLGLSPGGLLFVITLNAASLARPLLGRRWSWHLDATHVHMFSARRLRQDLTAAGYQMVTLTTLSNFFSAGEGSAMLKPLRRIGRVVRTPWFGDSLLAIARR
jgi:SAM-dependent methyltransferase